MAMDEGQRDEADALAAIRDRIDALDDRLVALLAERIAIAAEVADGKGDRPKFRPGREADILRRLGGVGREAGIEPSLIEGIWRQITAANLGRQGSFRVIVSGEHSGLGALARWRFGAGAVLQVVDDARAALEALAAGGDSDLAILPHWREGAWRAHDVNSCGRRCWLVSVLPFFPVEHLGSAAVFALHRPDPSIADTTLIGEGAGFAEKEGYHPDAPDAVGVFQKHCISGITRP